LSPHEAINHLAVLHCVHGGDRLDLERLCDTRIGIDIDLREFNLAVRIADDLVEDRAELLARTAPLGPQIDHDRDLVRPLDHGGLERCVGYVGHGADQRIGYRPVPGGRVPTIGRTLSVTMSRPVDPAELYTLLATPSLDDPVLLIHLAGWIDASGCAADARKTILEQINPTPVARFETEWLLDHRARRPMMHIVEGVTTALDWPEIKLVCGSDSTGNDVLFLHGVEPDHNWRTFCEAVVELAQRFGVRRVIGLGAYPASSPHTRPSRLSATASSPELAVLGFTPATLDVPAGTQAAVEFAAHEAGIPAVGLWAQVPHYLSGANYAPATQALIEGLVVAGGLVFDSSDLAAEALATRSRLNGLVADDDSHRSMLHVLERQYDNAMEVEASISGTDVAAEIAEFLRNQTDDDR